MILGGLVAVLIFIAWLSCVGRSPPEPAVGRSPPEPAEEDWFCDEYLPLDPDLDGRIDN